jgi:hypothetical protein
MGCRLVSQSQRERPGSSADGGRLVRSLLGSVEARITSAEVVFVVISSRGKAMSASCSLFGSRLLQRCHSRRIPASTIRSTGDCYGWNSCRVALQVRHACKGCRPSGFHSTTCKTNGVMPKMRPHASHTRREDYFYHRGDRRLLFSYWLI